MNIDPNHYTDTNNNYLNNSDHHDISQNESFENILDFLQTDIIPLSLSQLLHLYQCQSIEADQLTNCLNELIDHLVNNENLANDFTQLLLALGTSEQEQSFKRYMKIFIKENFFHLASLDNIHYPIIVFALQENLYENKFIFNYTYPENLYDYGLLFDNYGLTNASNELVNFYNGLNALWDNINHPTNSWIEGLDDLFLYQRYLGKMLHNISTGSLVVAVKKLYEHYHFDSFSNFFETHFEFLQYDINAENRVLIYYLRYNLRANNFHNLDKLLKILIKIAFTNSSFIQLLGFSEAVADHLRDINTNYIYISNCVVSKNLTDAKKYLFYATSAWGVKLFTPTELLIHLKESNDGFFTKVKMSLRNFFLNVKFKNLTDSPSLKALKDYFVFEAQKMLFSSTDLPQNFDQKNFTGEIKDLLNNPVANLPYLSGFLDSYLTNETSNEENCVINNTIAAILDQVGLDKVFATLKIGVGICYWFKLESFFDLLADWYNFDRIKAYYFSNENMVDKIIQFKIYKALVDSQLTKKEQHIILSELCHYINLKESYEVLNLSPHQFSQQFISNLNSLKTFYKAVYAHFIEYYSSWTHHKTAYADSIHCCAKYNVTLNFTSPYVSLAFIKNRYAKLTVKELGTFAQVFAVKNHLHPVFSQILNGVTEKLPIKDSKILFLFMVLSKTPVSHLNELLQIIVDFTNRTQCKSYLGNVEQSVLILNSLGFVQNQGPRFIYYLENDTIKDIYRKGDDLRSDEESFLTHLFTQCIHVALRPEMLHIVLFHKLHPENISEEIATMVKLWITQLTRMLQEKKISINAKTPLNIDKLVQLFWYCENDTEVRTLQLQELKKGLVKTINNYSNILKARLEPYFEGTPPENLPQIVDITPQKITPPPTLSLPINAVNPPLPLSPLTPTPLQNFESFEISPITNFIHAHKNKISNLYSTLEAAWFEDVPAARRMVQHLIHNQLNWGGFEVSYDMLKPLAEFMSGLGQQRKAAVAILSHFIELFELCSVNVSDPLPLLQNYCKGERVDAYQVIHHLIAFHQNKRQNASKNNSPALSTELAYTLFKVKWIEIKAQIQYLVHHHKELVHRTSYKSCFILAQDTKQAKVFAMMAQFNKKGLLTNFAKSPASAKLLFQYIESNLAEDIDETYILSAEKLKKFKEEVEKNIINMAPCIILERSKPPFSLAEEAQVSSDMPSLFMEEKSSQKTSEKGKKRKLSEITEEEINQENESHHPFNLNLPNHNLENTSGPKSHSNGNVNSIGFVPTGAYSRVEETFKPFKKQKTDSNHQKGPSVPTLTLGKEEVLTPQDPEKLWEMLTTSSLQVVSSKIDKQNARYDLLIEDKLQNFPIAEKLKHIQLLENYAPLNPLLMQYQETAAKEILEGFNSSISKILSLKMGLGKTFVILETLAQTILQQKEGINLIVVPVNIHEQMYREAIRYLEETKCQALRSLIHRDPELVEGITKKFENAFKKFLNKTENEISKLKSQFDHRHPFLEELKGYLRRFALLKTHLGCDFDLAFTEALSRQLKLMMTSHWENIYSKVAAIPPKKEKLLASLEALFQKELKDYPGFDAQQKTLDIPLLMNSLPSQILSSHNGKKLGLALGLLLDLNPDRPEVILENYSEVKLTKLLYYPSIQKLDDIHPGVIHGNFTGIVKNSQIEKLSNLKPEVKNKIQLVVVDEAHEYNNADNTTTKQMEKFVNGIPRKLFVTATPISNHYEELCQLIRMANPEAFSRSSLDALRKLIDDFTKGLLSEKVNPELLEELALKSFVHFYHLNTVLHKMVIAMDSTHPLVIANWEGRVPSVELVEHLVTVADKGPFHKITQQFLQSKRQLDFQTSTKKALIHTSAIDLKGSSYDAAHLQFKPNEIHQWIDGSAMLKPFYKNPETGRYGNEHFQQCVDLKLKGIIVVDYTLAAKLAKIVLDSSKEIDSYIYSGDMKIEERESAIKKFKEDSPAGLKKAKILILMMKAGGVGLDIPQADMVFGLAKTYSSSSWEQAYYRAIRVGNIGKKIIIDMNYDIFFSDHVKLVNQKKNKLTKLVLKNSPFIKKFQQWLKIAAYTAKQAEINQTKDLVKSETIFERIDHKIQAIRNQITTQDIKQIFTNNQMDYVEEVDEDELMSELDLLLE